MTKKKKKPIDRPNAVIYCRVSTDEQVQNLSLGTQEHRAIAHCTHEGWPVVKVFRDEGKSAKTTDRKEFQRMLRYCEDPANGVGFVVVNDLSRFSRNTNDLTATRAQLLAVGVVIRSVSESIDETSTGNFITTIFGAVHQLDNDRKSERTKAGMQAAIALGRWPHKAPIGYRNQRPIGDGPNVVPDPERSRLIKKAFEMAATGLHSKAEILRLVTGLGLKTAKGGPLPIQTFQKVLVNSFYAGWMVFTDWNAPVHGSYEPLITEELFTRVQDVLAGRQPTLTGYEKNRADFPLRVFVKCGKCGTPITASYSKGRKSKYPYYRCRKNCEGVKAKPDQLHAKFLGLLRQLAPQPSCMKAIKETIRTVWKQRQGDAEQLRTILSRKLSNMENRKNTLADRWLDGKVDEEIFQEHNGRLSAEIESVRGELRGTELQNIELERVLKFAGKIILQPARLWVESSLDQRQRLQRTLFPNGIEFDGDEFGTTSKPFFYSLLTPDPNDTWGSGVPDGI